MAGEVERALTNLEELAWDAGAPFRQMRESDVRQREMTENLGEMNERLGRQVAAEKRATIERETAIRTAVERTAQAAEQMRSDVAKAQAAQHRAEEAAAVAIQGERRWRLISLAVALGFGVPNLLHLLGIL